LRDGRLQGLKFRRQHPLDGCIADFCCPDRRLVVEVDGDVHLEPENAEKDVLRDEWLTSQGFTVLRVTNDQVVTELDNVLERIAAVADATA
jgi:very-short-patch-repair endonuclease